jgi:hypothetical protein
MSVLLTTLSQQVYTAFNWTINREGCGEGRPWPILKCCHSLRIETVGIKAVKYVYDLEV